jgi:hypothetical protein
MPANGEEVPEIAIDIVLLLSEKVVLPVIPSLFE